MEPAARAAFEECILDIGTVDLLINALDVQLGRHQHARTARGGEMGTDNTWGVSLEENCVSWLILLITESDDANWSRLRADSLCVNLE